MQREYEIMYIVSPILEDDSIEEVVDKLHDNVTKIGAIVKNVDKIGRKKLAYKVKNYNEGYYVVTKFETEPDKLKDIEKTYKYNEDVLRYIILKK